MTGKRDYKDVQKEGAYVSSRAHVAHRYGTFVRKNRKRAPGEYDLKEVVPVKGTNQVVEVTTFTRYPNYQTIQEDERSGFQR